MFLQTRDMLNLSIWSISVFLKRTAVAWQHGEETAGSQHRTAGGHQETPSRLPFRFTKNKYFPEDFWTSSSCVCGDETQYFQPKYDLYPNPNLLTLMAKTNESLMTALLHPKI